MKKIRKVFMINICIIILLFMINTSTVFADVGSFESYDSGGSDWGGSSSSWSSSSDWGSSSSDWGSSDIYIGGYGSGGSAIVFFIFLAIAVGVAISVSQSQRGRNRRNSYSAMNYYEKTPPKEVVIKDGFIVSNIQSVDPMFNKEEFLSFAKNLFVKLQEAWMNRDWSTIRVFETNELFEQHKRQLQGYIDRHQINMLERICVKSAYLQNFSQSSDKDILTVVLNSKMVDYIIDENTGNIIKGDTVTDRHSSYKMTFIRTKGIKTQEGTSEVKTTNCPNCGAPTEITSSGKCEYCGSVITTGEYNWVLSNLEKIQ